MMFSSLLGKGSMIPQVLVTVTPLVFATQRIDDPQFRAAARTKIPNGFLSPQLTAEQVRDLIQNRDMLTAETQQWPRALKYDLMTRIREKRKELERLEQQLLECERAIATEQTISIQHKGETLQVRPARVQAVAPVGPLEQLLNQILDFCWSAKLESSGTSRYQTDQALGEELRRLNLESSKFRYHLGTRTLNGALIPFHFSAARNYMTKRLAKIHYIQKILDEHALLTRCAQAIEKNLNGESAGVCFSVQESAWDFFLHGAMGDYQGPVLGNGYLDGLCESVFVYRQRISDKLRDLPRVLAH